MPYKECGKVHWKVVAVIVLLGGCLTEPNSSDQPNYQCPTYDSRPDFQCQNEANTPTLRTTDGLCVDESLYGPFGQAQLHRFPDTAEIFVKFTSPAPSFLLLRTSENVFFLPEPTDGGMYGVGVVPVGGQVTIESYTIDVTLNQTHQYVPIWTLISENPYGIHRIDTAQESLFLDTMVKIETGAGTNYEMASFEGTYQGEPFQVHHKKMLSAQLTVQLAGFCSL